MGMLCAVLLLYEDRVCCAMIVLCVRACVRACVCVCVCVCVEWTCVWLLLMRVIASLDRVDESVLVLQENAGIVVPPRARARVGLGRPCRGLAFQHRLLQHGRHLQQFAGMHRYWDWACGCVVLEQRRFVPVDALFCLWAGTGRITRASGAHGSAAPQRVSIPSHLPCGRSWPGEWLSRHFL